MSEKQRSENDEAVVRAGSWAELNSSFTFCKTPNLCQHILVFYIYLLWSAPSSLKTWLYSGISSFIIVISVFNVLFMYFFSCGWMRGGGFRLWVWINSVVEIVIVWYVHLFIKFCIEWFVVDQMPECDSEYRKYCLDYCLAWVRMACSCVHSCNFINVYDKMKKERETERYWRGEGGTYGKRKGVYQLIMVCLPW